MSSHCLVPLSTNSGYTATLSSTQNTIKAVTIPGDPQLAHTRPKAYRIRFIDGDGEAVMGRVGCAVASQASALDTTVASDTSLGYFFSNLDDPQPIPTQVTHLLVASGTASAKVYITWLYDR